MTDIVGSQLKLRRDAVYMKTEAGIVFRSRKGVFSMSGRSIYTTFQQLLPFFDGKTKGSDLLASLRNENRAAVSNLIETLLQRDVLQLANTQDALRVDEAVASAFQPQIEFIGHYCDGPHERFLAFRRKRILLTGDGVGFIGAGVALLRNGLQTLHISHSPGADPDLMAQECERLRRRGVPSEIIPYEPRANADRREFDMVLYCSERPDLSQIHRLNREAVEAGHYFLPALVYSNNLIVGPIVEPLNPGCWQCAMLRWTDNVEAEASSALWRRIALGQWSQAGPTDTAEVSSHMLGNTAALEAFKLFIGRPEPDAHSKLLKQDLSTMEASVKAILPHPDCAVCQKLHTRPKGGVVEANSLAKWSALLDEEFGAFQKFNDEDIEQLPLRVSALDFCMAATERHEPRKLSAIGWSLEDSDAARVHALQKAIEFKASLLIPADLRTTPPMHWQQDLERLDPRQITGWLGNSPADAACRSHLQWTDLRTSQPVLVPAEAVHPHFDIEGWFDRHSAGIGVAAEPGAAAERALLSLYKYITISSLAHGSLPVKRWSPEDSAPNRVTEYLLSTSRQIGLAELNVVIGSPCKGIYSAIALPQRGALCRVEDIVISTELSLRRAVDAVLTENIARAQVLRSGRRWQDVARCRGLYAKAEFLLRVTGEVVAPEVDDELTLEQVLNEISLVGKSVLCLDITPSDVQLTSTFHVMKALLVSGIGQGLIQTNDQQSICVARRHDPR